MTVLRPLFLTAAMALALAPATHAQQTPNFDPRALHGEVRGQSTRLFVLATPHLSGLQHLDEAALTPLLDRLAAFRPTAIAVEVLPGETLQGLMSYEAVYPGVGSSFGAMHQRLGAPGQAETGLSGPAAEAEARRLLANLTPSAAASDRRRLAATLAAAYDPASALVQWLRLPASERRPGDGVSADLADALDRYAKRQDETVLIGARLAARLGLERLFPVDDQTDSDIALSRMAALESAWPRIQAAMDNPDNRRVRALTASAAESKRLIETYRRLNAPETGAADVRGEWAPYLQLDLPEDLGRRRVIQWETRNLRMAANLREAMAETPGGRILMIVGSAHKPWIDAYMAQMHDVEIVSADEVLGAPAR